jgi:branched-chain amino acid transport system ATP-binding protein
MGAEALELTGDKCQFRHFRFAPNSQVRVKSRVLAMKPSTKTCGWVNNPPLAGAAHRSVDQMFDYFPRLQERRHTSAGSVSADEQQMCRPLLGNPLVILIHEPTEGLAPTIVAQVGECIKDMHAKGVCVVLVEQKQAIALKVSTQVCVMGHGRIAFEGTPWQLVADRKLLADWLAV